MSEQDTTPQIDTSAFEEKIALLEASLGEANARERLGFAKRIAEAEIQLGERYTKDMDKRVESLSAQPKEALTLLESSLSNRLKLQTPKPESKGEIATITEEREPNQVTVEEMKAWLRDAVFGFPPPSAEARRTVAKMRRNPDHPMAHEYATLFKGGSA